MKFTTFTALVAVVIGASLITSNSTYANEKPAKCIVKGGSNSSTLQYSGHCLFSLSENGAFTIRRSDGYIMPSINQVNVYVLSPGIAEVRGLTTNGINSRWGSAKRSQKDPACWTGSDFEVCAY